MVDHRAVPQDNHLFIWQIPQTAECLGSMPFPVIPDPPDKFQVCFLFTAFCHVRSLCIPVMESSFYDTGDTDTTWKIQLKSIQKRNKKVGGLVILTQYFFRESLFNVNRSVPIRTRNYLGRGRVVNVSRNKLTESLREAWQGSVVIEYAGGYLVTPL